MPEQAQAPAWAAEVAAAEAEKATAMLWPLPLPHRLCALQLVAAGFATSHHLAVSAAS